jgi:hypothetical protein
MTGITTVTLHSTHIRICVIVLLHNTGKLISYINVMQIDVLYSFAQTRLCSYIEDVICWSLVNDVPTCAPPPR